MTSYQSYSPAAEVARLGRVSVNVRHPRQERNWVLLMQAGWVGVALLAIAHLPLKSPAPSKPESPAITAARRPQASPLPQLEATRPVADLQRLFAGESESLVARTVGHAEGTRTPAGDRTVAYYGHSDPGNGVWNLGSFSFQHCGNPRYNCTTPEAADVHQLHRLQAEAAQLRQRAVSLGLTLTLEEELNGIDLANQAPLAALGQPGYAEYLLQAKQRGLKGQTAILEARLWSYWDAQKGQWDAPGLGNQEASIRHDQNRRLLAIARVLDVMQKSQGDRTAHRLLTRAVVPNPYHLQTQREPFLWWDAGYWDARWQRGRALAAGGDTAYDAGYQAGAME